MPNVTENAVRAALAQVRDPVTGRSAIELGVVRGLTVRDDHVGFVVEAPDDGDARGASTLEPLRAACEAAVRAVPGVARVTAVLTAHADTASTGPDDGAGRAPAASAPKARAPRGVRLSPAAEAQSSPGRPSAARALALPGVAHMLAVASGKGGVGKSTVAANLACALAAQGRRVGLIDADIYGPSAPILMGLTDADPKAGPDGKLIAPEAFGVKVMSMGFLVDADAPMIWRGPIVMSALSQLLADVAWAPLDVLVADLPPGTGDAQLTLVQRAPLSAALIVSTPQELALADVRRGAAMFARTHVPLLGVVENMSAFEDPASGVRFAPFGEGGARHAAAALGAPFLGALPLDPTLAALSDAGTPPAATAPDSPLGRAFGQLAEGVWAALAAGQARPAPRIRFSG